MTLTTSWTRCSPPSATIWSICGVGLLGFIERSDGFMELTSDNIAALIFSMRSDGFLSLDVPISSRVAGNYRIVEQKDEFLEFPIL